jgi:hypothetical protein
VLGDLETYGAIVNLLYECGNCNQKPLPSNLETTKRKHRQGKVLRALVMIWKSKTKSYAPDHVLQTSFISHYSTIPLFHHSNIQLLHPSIFHSTIHHSGPSIIHRYIIPLFHFRILYSIVPPTTVFHQTSHHSAIPSRGPLRNTFPSLARRGHFVTILHYSVLQPTNVKKCLMQRPQYIGIKRP